MAEINTLRKELASYTRAAQANKGDQNMMSSQSPGGSKQFSTDGADVGAEEAPGGAAPQ